MDRSQLRYLLSLAAIMVGSVGLCIAAESAGGADSAVSEWYKPLRELGVAGIFIAYLIYDRHEERKRKDSENERWKTMDQTLLDEVRESTAAKIELVAALKELRASHENMGGELQRLVTVTTTGNDFRRRTTDSEK